MVVVEGREADAPAPITDFSWSCEIKFGLAGLATTATAAPLSAGARVGAAGSDGES